MRVPPRKLTVLASLDVAGYTRHVERDERRTLTELAAVRLKVIRPTLAAHGGNLFKTMGDGALIEFQNVEDSVRWALAFQTAMAERNAGHGESALLVRCGVGLADVFVQGQDRFGAAVGFVVRLQQAAPQGGVAITHSVRWQLVKSLASLFHRVDGVVMKGFDEPMELWMWTPPDIAAPEFPARTPATPVVPASRPTALGGLTAGMAAPDLPSIVVLPFDNMSGEKSVDLLAAGIVEEITATLSRVRDFTVIARNSAYAYKGRAVDVRDIARQLGVRYVLEGSLRKAGDRVRITAQLIDAATGAHLWADRYDGIVENLFDFEDEIASRVAGALRPSIRDAEIAIARRKRPENLVAYDLVLRALPHLWAHRPEDNAEAIRLIDEALRLDPSYARAAAIAAWARAQDVVYNWTSDIVRVRAEGARLIEAAAVKAGEDATALAALSTATMLLQGDHIRARHFVERALAIDPNNAWAWMRRGFLEAYRGSSTEAFQSFEKAIRLSPLDPFLFNCFIGMGFANFAADRPREAIEWAERAMREKAGMTWANRDLAVYNALAGQIDTAKAKLGEFEIGHPAVSLRQMRETLMFMAPPILARYVEGLRIAGLPE